MTSIPEMYEQIPCGLSLARRKEIAEQFWGCNTAVTGRLVENNAYFEYFETQCRYVSQFDHPEDQICIQSNICDIVSRFKAGEDRATIKAYLASKIEGTSQSHEISILYTIDLAMRLWLMVHTGNMQREVTGQTALLWREGGLKERVAEHFQHQRILTDLVKFEKVFNARNIERIADVRIRWTPNLVDHLKFIEDGKKPILNIFHYAGFLNCHRETDFFPSGFVEETIRTLALLLPSHDRDSRKWFRNQQTKLKLDPEAMKCGQLKLEERQIDHFHFWHDRLVVLKQYFDDSSPRTFKQWWWDDRKRVSWYWVAILLVVCTVLFGIIQCIEGGWQIWKAYH